MIRLRSEIFPDFFKKKIDHSTKVAFFGSCFSENIGDEVKKAKIPCIVNPHGVLYNPASVSHALFNLMENKIFIGRDLAFYNEKWISFEHHGRFSGVDKAKVLGDINRSNKNAYPHLKDTSLLFITFGTAWVYRLKASGKIVANCHKLPADHFEHFLLQPDEILENYRNLLNGLKTFNPQLEVVFTVSPVRHWKDGAAYNQLSKSILIVAVHQLVSEFDFVHYFPSYELLMDDLRDYRFYADDLFHPNQLAIQYIWEKFCQAFFNEKTIETLGKIEKLHKNMEHRVFYPNTEAYKKFLAGNFKLIESLEKEFPALDFTNEHDYFMKEAEKFWPGLFISNCYQDYQNDFGIT